MVLLYKEIIEGGISFLKKMRVGQKWQFRFSEKNKPNLIGSSLAAMLAALLRWLDTLDVQQKKEWAAYINCFQRKDGFFEDDDINDTNRVPGYAKERALFHRTRHALFALNSLGFKPRYNFGFLEDIKSPQAVEKWMASLNLADFWDASNKIMDLAIFFSHDAILNNDRKAENAIQRIIDICDENTNPVTGYQDKGKSELRNAMAGAMHIYPVYFLWGRSPKYANKTVDTTISLQQSDGFFSYSVGTCGEDCLDYDAVNILVNFYFCNDYRRKDIEASLKKLLDIIGKCRNDDGGFCCHRRNENYRFGTITTEVDIGASSLWATYSRILTIAMATKVLKGHSAAGDWKLGNNIMEEWNGGLQKAAIYGTNKAAIG